MVSSPNYWAHTAFENILPYTIEIPRGEQILMIYIIAVIRQRVTSPPFFPRYFGNSQVIMKVLTSMSAYIMNRHDI